MSLLDDATRDLIELRRRIAELDLSALPANERAAVERLRRHLDKGIELFSDTSPEAMECKRYIDQMAQLLPPSVRR